ncbi:alpha/beta fold hydrolase [Skermania sp. ID1734]|uniref:alpha/beta fold hydrolase n=1 Tax=Skermania sp. ID1734 TaxID=2597516 RepID=UPI001180B2AF|nr:alpha/beta fold hydrolase [Skermania sp. ID1734]TSE00127.1 alpha/beta fold hydrolase [Skermania sp. ID1734]
MTSTLASSRACTVRNGDIELAVHEYGPPDAPTIVLVHGWPDTHHLWSGVVPLLADEFHVVAYDVRGHGESTNPPDVSDFRLSELAKDLFAVIDATSSEPVHLLAHDWGSVTGWEAVCEPGAERRIASFTSISGPNLDHLGWWVRDRLARPTPRNVAGPLSQLVSSAYTAFFMMPGLPRWFFGLLGTERNWRLALRFMEGMPVDKAQFAPTLRADMVSGLRIYRANIAQRLLNPRERHTEVPVQLLINTRDVAVRAAGYADTERWVRRLVRQELPTGHWLPYSQPTVVAEATRQFVGSLR